MRILASSEDRGRLDGERWRREATSCSLRDWIKSMMAGWGLGLRMSLSDFKLDSTRWRRSWSCDKRGRGCCVMNSRSALERSAIVKDDGESLAHGNGPAVGCCVRG